jgi:hypothetical protein
MSSMSWRSWKSKTRARYDSPTSRRPKLSAGLPIQTPKFLTLEEVRERFALRRA